MFYFVWSVEDFEVKMYDILSLSLYQSSAGIAASILLRALLPFYDLDNHSVFFVRWFWAPFFEQVV